MSAFGGKADMALCGNSLSRSLLGVKRTWLVAAHMSAFDPYRRFATRLRCSAVDAERGYPGTNPGMNSSSSSAKLEWGFANKFASVNDLVVTLHDAREVEGLKGVLTKLPQSEPE